MDAVGTLRSIPFEVLDYIQLGLRAVIRLFESSLCLLDASFRILNIVRTLVFLQVFEESSNIVVVDAQSRAV